MYFYPYYSPNPYFYFYSGYIPYPVSYSPTPYPYVPYWGATPDSTPYTPPPMTPNPYDWRQIKSQDQGPNPVVLSIEEMAEQNDAFRVALWTGKHLQLTLMNINIGEDIGLELHNNIDQFIYVEEGQGMVKMGDRKDHLDYQHNVSSDDAILIPAGTWHNIINTGNEPLKLFSIYAPANHPHGTVQQQK